ncbi:sugar MFS transporter [Pontibacter akesuensis]|uniref:MFS transporter, FHS family, L-fucose permease n=1 Tax=Pontibacter akesuensis TaxID=388950 RepID=A0A1I7GTM0_9BACT|nr:sugar MFS transporter [Pontibacter akesuensis]GHA55223.1 sugar transporter [Pontibacter akesuensis]SFU51586.1 MFS transporter, FHS family, L-fucose permease [Pontibacter akesuensis]
MAGSIQTDVNAAKASHANSVNENYRGPLVTVTLLFFMWGFITCLNDILIPKLQQVFTLELWQAMLIQTAFFGAYFIVSLLYFVLSITKGDPIRRIGYKNGIIIGLVVAAIGCALFYPAADQLSYTFFLGALFVLASGITFLQIAANPYVTILGPAEGAASRLNLTQALNSLGTTVAPIIGGYLIFGAVNAQDTGADSVKMPYLGLAAALLAIALLIKIAKLPNIQGDGDGDGDANLSPDAGALRYRHLVLGIICIFAYVGGEVAIGSALINFFRLPEIAGLDETQAGHFLAFYWGGAMVGRFFGAVALSNMRNTSYKYLIIAGIAAVVFVLLYTIYGMDEALIVLGLIALNFVVLMLGRFIPSKTLGYFAGTVVVLLLFTIFAEGAVAMWAVIAIGLFNSIMFPTIFTLAVKGLGVHTSQGSSLLVMAIVGGAIVPPLQGLVADLSGSLQLSFLVPLICYLYILYYGFVGSKVKETAI